MSRWAALLAGMAAGPVAAQDPPVEVEQPNGGLVIDILEAAELQDCSAEQQAAELSGEIIVCRRRRTDEEAYLGRSREDWADDYAERSKGSGPVDVAGPGIFTGPPTASGFCFIPPCPTAAMPEIDFAALPEAPPGSDADRIARGLAPRGNDEGDKGE